MSNRITSNQNKNRRSTPICLVMMNYLYKYECDVHWDGRTRAHWTDLMKYFLINGRHISIEFKKEEYRKIILKVKMQIQRNILLKFSTIYE